MTNTKATKRAFFGSAISLLLCVAMLIGSTFAWFTDSASTGVNSIIAGNLDVELYKGTADASGAITWESDAADNNTKLFKDGILWEPGHTEVSYFKVVNEGNLAVKYEVAARFTNEKGATSVEGNTFKLSEILKYNIVELNTENDGYTGRADANADATLDFDKSVWANPRTGTLEKGVESYFAIIVTMPDSVGNEANYRGEAPSIDLGVELVATQLSSEADSFGTDYDSGVDYKYPQGTIPGETNSVVSKPGTAADLKNVLETAFQNGGNATVTVTLTNNIDVNNEWSTFEIPNTSKDITIDGAGYTISNLDKPLVTGLWGGGGTLTFKNLTIDNADINGYDSKTTGSMSAAGAFMAYADHAHEIAFESCKLTNSKIVSNAEYVGGLMGYSSADSTTFKNCSVEGSTISGYKSAGAIIGHIGANVTISDTASKSNIITGNTQNREWGVGAIFGRSSSSITTTMTNITISGNTITQEGATDAATSEYYGKSYGTTTLDGNTI